MVAASTAVPAGSFSARLELVRFRGLRTRLELETIVQVWITPPKHLNGTGRSIKR